MTNDIINHKVNRVSSIDEAKDDCIKTLARMNGISVESAESHFLMLQRRFAGTCGEEGVIALLRVAQDLHLEVLANHLAVSRNAKGDIEVSVTYDGWLELVKRNPEYAGLKFDFSKETVCVDGKETFQRVNCRVFRRRPDGNVIDVEWPVFPEVLNMNNWHHRNEPKQSMMEIAQLNAMQLAFPDIASRISQATAAAM